MPSTGSGCEMPRRDLLPSTLAPRGLKREEAAAYIGVSPATFDLLVEMGQMPPAKQIRTRKVWDRLALDLAFSALPDSGGAPSDAWGNVTA